MDYKDTLNMPNTDFEMRGNLAQKEPGTLLFLPCFSQAVGAALRFQPSHVVDAERPGLPRSPAAHSKRQCHKCPTWRALVARLASLRHVQRGQPDRYDDAPGHHHGKVVPSSSPSACSTSNDLLQTDR